MTALFDSYRASYREAVQSSIDFSGLRHDFFLRAKARLLRALIAERLGTSARPAMLDVGCGVASLHPLLHGTVGSLSGIDVSAESIAQARADNPHGEYRAFDGRRFPFDRARFDLATAVCVLHHVAPPDWPGFVAELRRVVRPGGLVCVIEHNPLNPLTRFAVMRCEFDRDARLLLAGSTRRLMAEAGFSALDTRFFLLLPWETEPARRVEGALRRMPFGAQYASYGTA